LTECSADVVCVHDQQRIRRIGLQLHQEEFRCNQVQCL
jgi:hypothetical protein